VITATLLVILPTVAVMLTCPAVVLLVTMVTVPADTVARFVLLEFHVATLVTSAEPLQVVALAVIETVGALVVIVPLVGLSVIALIHPTVTVTLWVAVTVGFWFEVAVTVAVPTLADVTRPALVMVATDVGFTVQETEGLLVVLPSLFVPTACICTVLSVLPVSIVGEAGPTDNEESVGFTKNPLQLAAKAKVKSTANEPISLRFLARMLFWDSFRPLDQARGAAFLLSEIVAEKIPPRMTLPCHSRWNLSCTRTNLGRDLAPKNSQGLRKIRGKYKPCGDSRPRLSAERSSALVLA
jgi:hypothetical protein